MTVVSVPLIIFLCCLLLVKYINGYTHITRPISSSNYYYNTINNYKINKFILYNNNVNNINNNIKDDILKISKNTLLSTLLLSLSSPKPAVSAPADNLFDITSYRKGLLNVPSDDFWYPPYMIGKWNTSLTFLGFKYANNLLYGDVFNNKKNKLPGFDKYSIIFLPIMGKNINNLMLRYVQLDSHPREDHPFNLRSLVSSFSNDTIIDSAPYSYQKAPDWFHSPANKWVIKYHDSKGNGEIELFTRKRNIKVFAGTIETIEFFRQTHKRKNINYNKITEETTIGDYALNWKLSVPASQQDRFITATDLSSSMEILGTLEVLVFFQPTDDLYFKTGNQAAGVFTYNVTMNRAESVEDSSASTVYPFVWREDGPVELQQYFGY